MFLASGFENAGVNLVPYSLAPIPDSLFPLVAAVTSSRDYF
jgi:hypothetical protein